MMLTRRQIARSRRATFEQLEDRCLLAAVSAILPGGGQGDALLAGLQPDAQTLATPASPTLTAAPVADTYVQFGNPDTNYGTSTAINVKNNGAAGSLTRYGLLKFDLGGITSALASVQLRLYGHLSDTTTTNVVTDLYPVADTTWRESGTGGVTWNTQPACGATPLGSVTVVNTSYAWYSFDVTSYAQAEKAAGRNVISFMLENPLSTSPLTAFNSKEAASNQSQLVLMPNGAAASAISTTRIDVSWVDTNGGTASYAVERSTDNANFALVGSTATGGTSFSDTSGLAEGLTYYYRVQASSGGNTSAYLSGGYTMTLPLPPAAPVLAASSGAINVTWTNNSQGALGYVVERSTDGVNWCTLANVSGTGMTSYADTAPPVEGLIYYRVRAADSGGVSSASAASSVVYSYPLAPGKLTYNYPSEGEIDVSWTNNSASALGFYVERSPDGLSGWTQIGATTAGTTTFADPGRALYATYFYRVRAYNSLGDSADSPAVQADRLLILRQEGLNTIAALDAELAKIQPNPDIRELTQTAYIALGLGIPDGVAKAESYMRAAFDRQLADGNFGWSWNDTTNTDPNSVEFTMLPVGVIFLRYGNLLDASFTSYALPHIQKAITAVENHSVAVSYTNIYTMKATNLLLLGQVANDSTAQAMGAANVASWLNELHTNGIHEYDSPPYANVTYNNLLIGYNNTGNAAARDQLKTGLDYLAADLAGNYFAGQAGGKLSGPHSRDYDFLDGTGSIDHLYYIEGLRTAAPSIGNYSDGSYTYLNVLEGGYHPPAWLWALAGSTQRVVKEKFGSSSGQDRYNYLTGDFAIGSASSYYGPQDKQIAVDLASSKLLPQVTLVEDQWDSPYGNVKTADSSGHLKPTHLKNSIAAVQEQGSILALSNLGPQFSASPTTTYTSVGSNIVFPSQVDHLYLNGVEITNRTGTINTSVGAVLGIREGNAVVAVRVFQADGLGGYSPTVAIKFDGSQWNAARLVAYHYNGAAQSFAANTTCRAGVLIVAADCASDAEAAAFLQSVKDAPLTNDYSGGQWSASAALPGITLAAALNTSNNSIVYRNVNGIPYQSQLFTLFDGNTTQDLAAAILKATNAPVLAGTSANDNYIVQLDARGANIEVFQNVAADQRPTYSYAYSAINTLGINGQDGDDWLTLDFTQGNPVPTGGLNYDGGSGSNTLAVVGRGSATMTATQVVCDGAQLNYSSVAYEGFSEADLTVSACTMTLGADNAISAGTNLTVADGGTLDLNGHSDTTALVTLANGSIVNGTLIGTSYTVQNGTISAVLGGSGSLTKNDPANSNTSKVILSGANTYTGNTTVDVGILDASLISNAGTTTVNSNTTLQVNAIQQHELTIAAGGKVVLGGVASGAGPLITTAVAKVSGAPPAPDAPNTSSPVHTSAIDGGQHAPLPATWTKSHEIALERFLSKSSLATASWLSDVVRPHRKHPLYSGPNSLESAADEVFARFDDGQFD